MNAVARKVTALLGTALTAAAVLVALSGTAANASDATPDNGTIQTGSAENLSSDQLALLESDQLKRISIDPATGNVTAVQPMTSAELRAEISAATAKPGGIQPFSVGTNCSLNATPCWYGVAPAVNYSFSSGITDGTWTNRKNFWTGTNFFAKLCWLDPFGGAFPATICMPERNGPNAWIELGYAVTGKKADVSITRG
ncbi:hypothetical protein ACIPY5_03640 [Microbacterium sp. NPDC089698]|uniref:hypothetical protein n=1 Tax=Microbacterium sp. NPDC089698 TaxID=3364200 RepID=UPI00380A831F